MVAEQHVATLIHEIRELKKAIDRFERDAQARSGDVSFDFAAITQWGYELAGRLEALDSEDIPEPRSGFEAEDPAYLRALKDAQRLHADAKTIGRSLTVCLDAITSIDDETALWSAVPHLEQELEALETTLTRFASDLRSSASFPSDS